MKILSFTAGAASMYCGSCLRDNALAAELKRQGHDITLLPLYTPTLTDEANVSEHRVFLNGIAVYLEQETAYFRGEHRLLDRLVNARWMLKLAAKSSIAVDPQRLGEMTVSMLRGEDGLQSKQIRRLADWLRGEPPSEVGVLPNSLLIGLARPLGEAMRCPICCTLQGEELFLTQLPEPFRTQAGELIRAKAADIDAFVAVSHCCARYWVSAFGLPERKVHVVRLGISLDGFDGPPAAPSCPFTVGFFARIAPEKGLRELAEAYILLRRRMGSRPAALRAAGYLAPEHKPYLQAVRQRLNAAALGHEFHYDGSPDRAAKIAFLRGLHVLSVPCTYDEPKGLSLLEAMAAGVPIVQPRRGAFPEIVEQTAGGILVEPDNPASLADALYGLSIDPAAAVELGRQGAAGVREHYSAGRMAARALEIYQAVAAQVPPLGS